MTKPTLIVMCGVPGSGKDYAIAHSELLNDANEPPLVVSRDAIRYSLVKENAPYFSREKEVFKTFIAQICNGLAAGKEVIANATHINVASRSKLLNAVRRHYSEDFNVIYYVIIRNYDIIAYLNAKRQGRERVPEKSLKEIYNKFSIPSLSEDPAITYIILQGEDIENFIISRVDD